MKASFPLALSITLSGCAGVNFNAGEDGAVYFEPVPYILYARTDKCVSSATPVTLPGNKRHLAFKNGYGSSSLSAEFTNGLLTKVGQTSDSKIPETLTSISGLANAGVLSQGSTTTCDPKAVLFPVVNGVPDLTKPLDLNLGQ